MYFLMREKGIDLLNQAGIWENFGALNMQGMGVFSNLIFKLKCNRNKAVWM